MARDSRAIFQPSRFLFFSSVVIWLAFQLITPQIYLELFKSQKINNLPSIFIMTSVLILVILFSLLGEIIGHRKPQSDEIGRRSYIIPNVPGWWITSALFITIFAYLIWFGVGSIRAGGVLSLFAAYRDNAFYVKETLLLPVTGITSFTQIAVIAIPMAIIKNQNMRYDRLLIYIIVFFAILRSFLFSERLAIFEILLPIFLINVFIRKVSFSKGIIVVSLILFSVISFFILNESGRSFAARGILDFQSIVLLGVFRFFGYYLTSVNNYGLALENYSFHFPFYFSLLPIWKLPGLENLYSVIFSTPSFNAPEILALNGLNPELNVFTTPGYWIMEFGVAGLFLMAASFGFLSGFLYSKAKYSGFWLIFYSMWFLGILEFMRIYYFGSPRVFIPIIYFTVTVMLFQTRSSRGTSKYAHNR